MQLLLALAAHQMVALAVTVLLIVLPWWLTAVRGGRLQLAARAEQLTIQPEMPLSPLVVKVVMVMVLPILAAAVVALAVPMVMG